MYSHPTKADEWIITNFNRELLFYLWGITVILIYVYIFTVHVYRITIITIQYDLTFIVYIILNMWTLKQSNFDVLLMTYASLTSNYMYLSIVIIATMIKVAVTVVLIRTNSIFWLYKLISAWHFCINFRIFVTSSSEYVRYVHSSEYTSSSRVWLWLCRHVWFPPIFLYSPWKVRSRGWMKLFELRPFPKHTTVSQYSTT